MAGLENVSEALVIRPGDHLVVRVPSHTHCADIEELLTQARDRFPDNEVTVLNTEQFAVIRKDES